MVQEVLGLFMKPVTTAKERADAKNIKKEAIIALILAVIIGLSTILSLYIGGIKAVNTTYKSLKSYNKKQYREVSEEEFKELKKEAKEAALENIKFGKIFFKVSFYSLLANAILAGILFLISVLIKSQIDFAAALSITNSSYIFSVCGLILYLIFSFIYSPIGVVCAMILSIYGFFTLLETYKECITVTDPDKFIQISTAVVGVVYIILYIIIVHYVSSLVSSLLSF